MRDKGHLNVDYNSKFKVGRDNENRQLESINGSKSHTKITTRVRGA